MCKIAIAIVTTHRRAKMLDDCFYSLQNQDCNLYVCEDIIDKDNQDVRVVCNKWGAFYTYLERPEGVTWRSPNAGWNRLMEICENEYFMTTHSDIIFYENIIDTYNHLIGKGKCILGKPFYLPECDIESVNWKANVNNLKNVPGFWQHVHSAEHGIDNRWIEKTLTYASDGIACYHISDVKNMHFRDFHQWGFDDPECWAKRRGLGLVDIVIPSPMGFHQNHDTIEPRKKV